MNKKDYVPPKKTARRSHSPKEEKRKWTTERQKEQNCLQKKIKTDEIRKDLCNREEDGSLTL